MQNVGSNQHLLSITLHPKAKSYNSKPYIALEIPKVSRKPNHNPKFILGIPYVGILILSNTHKENLYYIIILKLLLNTKPQPKSKDYAGNLAVIVSLLIVSKYSIKQDLICCRIIQRLPLSINYYHKMN